MCGLFGMFDIRGALTARQKTHMIQALARASEVRGTDATGVAYMAHGKMQVYKRPLSAHRMRIRIPEDARAIMGHVRMVTQGVAARNYNNHPWNARLSNGQVFALAHNGVLRNDKQLKRQEHLPKTNIETDSYVAVQLLQKNGTLNLESLCKMAEQVEGSFTFTILESNNKLYFVRGDNPLCIRFYPEKGLYLYASTELILENAMLYIPYRLGCYETVACTCGEILCLDSLGNRNRASFDTGNLMTSWYSTCAYWPYYDSRYNWGWEREQKEYIRLLKGMARQRGLSDEDVDELLADGFTTDDIEELIYSTPSLVRR